MAALAATGALALAGCGQSGTPGGGESGGSEGGAEAPEYTCLLYTSDAADE